MMERHGWEAGAKLRELFEAFDREKKAKTVEQPPKVEQPPPPKIYRRRLGGVAPKPKPPEPPPAKEEPKKAAVTKSKITFGIPGRGQLYIPRAERLDDVSILALLAALEEVRCDTPLRSYLH